MALLAITGCASDGSDEVVTALTDFGYHDVEVTVRPSGEAAMVGVRASRGPGGDTGVVPTEAAEIVWKRFPHRVASVTVAVGGVRRTFSRAEMLDLFGSRDPALDVPVEEEPGLPVGWLLVGGILVVAVALGTWYARIAQKPVEEGGLSWSPVASARVDMQTGLPWSTRPESDEDEEGSGAPIEGQDVRALVEILHEAGASHWWVTGTWAQAAIEGEDLEEHRILELIVDRIDWGVVRQELEETGFSVTVEDRDYSSIEMRDAQDRWVAIRLVDTAADGSVRLAHRGAAADAPRLAAADALRAIDLGDLEMPVCWPLRTDQDAPVAAAPAT